VSAAAAATIEAIAGSPHAGKAVRYLRSAIANTTMDPANRIAAMKALVAIGGAGANDAFPELTGAVSDSDSSVRREACLTLGQLGHPATDTIYRAAIAALQQAMRDDDMDVRLTASEAIVAIVRPR
jgi:HEAT repeat protein